MSKVNIKRMVIGLVVLIVVSVASYGIYRLKFNPNTNSKEQQDAVSQITNSEKSGDIPVAGLEDTKSEIGIDLSKIKEEARLSLKKRTAGREVDKDVEPIYISNYMIKYLYTSDKARAYYEKKTESKDDAIIMKALSSDVADYLNKELTK